MRFSLSNGKKKLPNDTSPLRCAWGVLDADLLVANVLTDAWDPNGNILLRVVVLVVVCSVELFVVWFSRVLGCRCFTVSEVGRLVLLERLCDVYIRVHP